MTIIAALLTDESAQGLVEYALIVSFVSIACIATLKILGQRA